MKCSHLRARLGDFLDGNLSASDRQNVAAHLESCAQCQNTHQKLADEAHLARAALRELTPVAAPASLRLKVRSAIQDEREAQARRAPNFQLSRLVWAAPLCVGALALILLVKPATLTTSTPTTDSAPLASAPVASAPPPRAKSQSIPAAKSGAAASPAAKNSVRRNRLPEKAPATAPSSSAPQAVKEAEIVVDRSVSSPTPRVSILKKPAGMRLAPPKKAAPAASMEAATSVPALPVPVATVQPGAFSSAAALAKALPSAATAPRPASAPPARNEGSGLPASVARSAPKAVSGAASSFRAGGFTTGGFAASDSAARFQVEITPVSVQAARVAAPEPAVALRDADNGAQQKRASPSNETAREARSLAPQASLQSRSRDEAPGLAGGRVGALERAAPPRLDALRRPAPVPQQWNLKITAPRDVSDGQIRLILPATVRFDAADSASTRVVWRGDLKSEKPLIWEVLLFGASGGEKISVVVEQNEAGGLSKVLETQILALPAPGG